MFRTSSNRWQPRPNHPTPVPRCAPQPTSERCNCTRPPPTMQAVGVGTSFRGETTALDRDESRRLGQNRRKRQLTSAHKFLKLGRCAVVAKAFTCLGLSHGGGTQHQSFVQLLQAAAPVRSTSTVAFRCLFRSVSKVTNARKSPSSEQLTQGAQRNARTNRNMSSFPCWVARTRRKCETAKIQNAKIRNTHTTKYQNSRLLWHDKTPNTSARAAGSQSAGPCELSVPAPRRRRRRQASNATQRNATTNRNVATVATSQPNTARSEK